MAFFEKIARNEKAVLLPMAGKNDSHEKDSSVMDASDTPATIGNSVAYTYRSIAQHWVAETYDMDSDNTHTTEGTARTNTPQHI